MSGILFDTSAYIAALRTGDVTLLSRRNIQFRDEPTVRTVWLSVVVLEELLAGAVDVTSRKLFARLERDFDAVNRLLTPNRTDWTDCGKILALIGAKYGYEQIGRARLSNDALIAVSAARNGFVVLTKNAADFRRIAEYRAFYWEEI